MTSSCKIHHLAVMNFTRYSRSFNKDENWLVDAARQLMFDGIKKKLPLSKGYFI